MKYLKLFLVFAFSLFVFTGCNEKEQEHFANKVLLSAGATFDDLKNGNEYHTHVYVDGICTIC